VNEIIKALHTIFLVSISFAQPNERDEQLTKESKGVCWLSGVCRGNEVAEDG